MVSVVMPALELAQETGKLVAWKKREGDHVRKGEPLLEIETDKAVVEIEAPGDGMLAGIRAHDGAVVPVGQTIAWLVQPGEPVPADDQAVQSARRIITEIAASSASLNPGAGARPASEIRISPKARRIAKDHRVDLATIKGTGPAGEILAADIECAIAQSPIPNQSAIPQSPIPNQSAIRNPQSAMSTASRLMASRATQSWMTVPHFFLTRDVDARALNAAREKLTSGTHTDILVAVVARALAKHPRMNASWVNDAVRPNGEVNVAIAIAVEDAVVIGVIHRADRLSIADIGARRRELANRARAARLQPADITGATFTISNLGMYDVDAFTAIIVPPQAGILAVGTIAERIVAVDGQPAARPMMTLTLSCDHRVVDGASGAKFLGDVVEGIQEYEH
jgi:pyruvate dehydrogenase E2 component (dihydrolipoyllysine-residue acetyltransferase)